MAQDTGNATDGVDMKLVAIEGGGDWNDASVEYLVVPKGTDLAKVVAQYRERHNGDRKLSLSEWLTRECGAREATEEHIEVLYD